MTVAVLGSDAINFFTHYYDPSPPNQTTIEDCPITILTNYSQDTSAWFGPAGLLGLGPSSTVLQRLYDTKAISSRSFGLYLGTAYPRAGGAINGSLTVGGYDSGRIQGTVYNHFVSLDSSDSTPFKVTVQQLSITSAEGRTTNLTNNPFDAYITASQYGLSLPSDVTQNFVNLTAATPANTDNQSLQLPADFSGNLSITLDSGLTVTFPPEWLNNASNISPISAAPLEQSSDNNNNATQTPALLGTAFLSMIYLIANYDSAPPTFNLALADVEALYIMTQPLCPNDTPAAAAPTPISNFASSGTIGAILGGVIGGIGLSFLAWWLLRRIVLRRLNARMNATTFEGITSEPVHSKQKGSSFESSSQDTEMADFNVDSSHNRFRWEDQTVTTIPTRLMPNTPRTPTPFLSSHSPLNSPAIHTSSSPAHTRSNSETQRQLLRLSVKTNFGPPPRSGTIGIARKPIGGRVNGTLRKMYPSR